ncbi:hypothetical protein CFN78_24795 [Amycolatopsis antarctica]|uniref:FAD-binding oxidoreductase/transferase type 4 C-terminal domain-containing protein n=1 Tax=Amycolatopsis antarctica TaxID=1854586 RepID=A0A263CX06_9PSEU|nr:FAD-linked oxidase C-terminal domain-containing protein [Amycolatopsis antarctica]OZM70621.1 hypothetical protein CFN78_24795 [Amycolatopsis antarctica]
MRLRDRPRHKASAAVRFDSTAAATEALRAVAQSGMLPSNYGLLDPGEATFSGSGDGLARMSAIVETFETATTWERVPELVDAVRTEVGAAVRAVCGTDGIVNHRFTHAYPDGAAPYLTVIAPGRRGSKVAMWDEIKAAAGETLSRHRATITHHHAVGRDHRPRYDRQRPELFAAALPAVKGTLDPQGVLNPGVLLD